MPALMFTRMHTLADVVADKLAEYLSEDELSELENDDVLDAGQEWLGDDECIADLPAEELD